MKYADVLVDRKCKWDQTAIIENKKNSVVYNLTHKNSLCPTKQTLQVLFKI